MSRRPWPGTKHAEDTSGKKKDRGKANRIRRRRTERWALQDQQDTK